MLAGFVLGKIEMGYCPPNSEWSLGLWDLARVSLKGPLENTLYCCWVWFHLADLLLPSLLFAAVDTAKNRLMILACSQEAAVSSVTWPPSRSHFAAGSSCLLLKTDFEWDLRELLCQHCP